MKKITFNHSENREFNLKLRQKVKAHLQQVGTSKGTSRMNFKIAFYLGALALSVASLYLFPGKWLSLLSWSLIGLFTAFSALNICHDAIHGSISTNQKTNKFFSSLFNLLGANDFVWDYSHNKVHHSFTNVQGQDEDVDAIPFVRTSPHQAHKKYHKYQVYYAPFFYSLATLSWVFVKDFVKIAQGQIGETTMKIERRDVVRLIAYKLAYYTLFLIIPLLVLPYSITWILAGFIISHLIEGFTIGIIFMLAHLVESVDFPMPDGEGKLQDNWAVHQLKTTSNFAIKSKFVFFLTGGLNFQVEHHLFPDVCHVHYPAISKIVAETAVEYGLPYHANRTLTGAIRSHVRFLKQMGSAATV